MPLRDKIIWSVGIVLAVALLVIAGRQLDFINARRQDMGLIMDRPENVPPSLAFATVATGAFRGLLVDILWIRADRLKEQGQFFDAKQLAEWITVLQPRFAEVWEFHAWNMAYNISVTIPETRPDQRWQWVKNGYELIRDQGIEKNPKSILLYRELARIFQHKIGGVTDEAHKYYKIQLALAMEQLIGAADNENFKALADAPENWQQIISDANISPIITAMQTADGEFADDDRFVSNYLSLRQNPKEEHVECPPVLLKNIRLSPAPNCISFSNQSVGINRLAAFKASSNLGKILLYPSTFLSKSTFNCCSNLPFPAEAATTGTSLKAPMPKK